MPPQVYAARKLRRVMTLPEVMLWQHLRGRPAGLKFRRQHPIGPYVVDFLASAAKLAIEIDGIAHDGQERQSRDAARDDYIRAAGFAIVRLSAVDVLRDLNRVVASIVSLAAPPLYQASLGPPPRAGEE